MTYDVSGVQPRNTQKNEQYTPTRTLIIIFLGLCFISAGLAGYFFLQRMRSLEQKTSEVNTAIEELRTDIDTVAQIAALARSSAMQAEEFARIAAEGRAEAEASKVEFEERAEMARLEASFAKEELARFRKEREAELNRLQQALSKIAETRRTALGLVMNLGADQIQFDFDKATLKPKNREILSRIAGVLLTSQGYRVQIYGHTDNVGTDEYNLTLSEERARTVREYLVEAGVNPAIISTKGFGKSNPLVPGNRPEARAKNRRVEIGIIDTMIRFKGPVE